jgi:3-oxoacyl-[acyl-carrier-protein] synthase III
VPGQGQAGVDCQSQVASRQGLGDVAAAVVIGEPAGWREYRLAVVQEQGDAKQKHAVLSQHQREDIE